MTSTTNNTGAQDVATAMFGCTEQDMVTNYGPGSINMIGGPMMLAMSIMSDAQELIARDQNEEARQLINRAKWVLGQKLMAEREQAENAARAAAEERERRAAVRREAWRRAGFVR